MAIPHLPPVLQDVLNPPTLPPAVTPPVTTPGTTPGPTPFTPGLTGTGEAPWVAQQRAMLLGMADRDQWPDWIRAAYGLPARDPNAAASPYIDQITNQQRKAQQIAQQGARLRAARPAAAPVNGVPAFLNSALQPADSAGAFAAPAAANNPYPMLSALSAGGNVPINQAASGGGGVGAAGVPSIGTVAPVPARRGLFS